MINMPWTYTTRITRPACVMENGLRFNCCIWYNEQNHNQKTPARYTEKEDRYGIIL